jgi:PhzF family phenazine biosynthesis protein
MGVRVHHYEAFSATPGMGNPAGVVLGDEYPDGVMQAVAERVGFNETVFVTAARPGAVALRPKRARAAIHMSPNQSPPAAPSICF